mmetsp:Transcript_19416/g.40801  ORF Transcript_19416/g.40801 Transcript_19416/m.40801 type:complete len:452 (-) Transcript_19416:209-1564(-)
MPTPMPMPMPIRKTKISTSDTFEDEIAFSDDDEYVLPPFGGSHTTTKAVRFEGLAEAGAKAERRRKRRRKRYERIGKIAACVLLVCVLVAVVLCATLLREAEHVLYQDSLVRLSESPSAGPTAAKPTVPHHNKDRFTPPPGGAGTRTKTPTFHTRTPPPTVRHTRTPSGATQADTHTNTEAPTVTASPTSAMRNSYAFEPVGDTYVYLDGAHTTKNYGTEETFWVQHGNKETTRPGEPVTIPTVVGILEFDLSKPTSGKEANANKNKNANTNTSTSTNASQTQTHLPKRSRWPDSNATNNHHHQMNVTLRIHHVAKTQSDDNIDETSVEDLPPISIAVYRLPNNHDWVVESLTGDDFRNAPSSSTSGILVNQVLVGSTDTAIDIDVTPAVFLDDGSTDGNTNTNTNTHLYADDQVLLLLKVYWEETPREGDLFQTRESDDGSPQLIFSNML